MPPTRGATRMGEVDGGFTCYVVLVRDAFEVKVKKRLGHEGFPGFLSADSVKGSTPTVYRMASHRGVKDRIVVVDVNHNPTKARCVSLSIDKNAANE